MAQIGLIEAERLCAETRALVESQRRRIAELRLTGASQDLPRAVQMLEVYEQAQRLAAEQLALSRLKSDLEVDDAEN